MKSFSAIGILSRTTYKLPAHMHNYWEIIYYTQGEGTVTIGNQVFHFQPGSIICQPPQIAHSEYAENGYRNIFFSVDSFKPLTEGIPQYRDNETKVIYNILMQLNTEFYLRRTNWRNITEALLNSAFQYMQSFISENTKNAYVENMEQTIISNISNPDFSIHEVMNNIPLSKGHARRLFVKETGKTPTDYLTEKRIDSAKQSILSKMENRVMNFKEIAYQSGFGDPYYFSRVFKNVTGESPTQWCKSRQKR